MKNIGKEILNALMDKYEKSKLSKVGSKVNTKIKLTTSDKVLSIYDSNEAYLKSDEYDAAIRTLESRGFIEARFNNESFKELTLNLDRVEEIYDFLNRANPKDELKRVVKVLDRYSFNNFMNDFISYIRSYIEAKGDFPKSYFSDSIQLDSVLKSIEGILKLEENTMRRDFSSHTLGDSKIFEKIEGKVCKILREFGPYKEEENDDLLEEYYIIKNSTYALVKGGLVIKINNQIIDLEALGTEMALSDEMIDRLEILGVGDKKVITTIENLTTFYKYESRPAVIIYLGGFHNHTKQRLIMKIHEKYPDLLYYHWGDIDAGGFSIFNTLVKKTGIEFKPAMMGINELKRFKGKLKELTANDRKRLEEMRTNDDYEYFHNAIDYMLDNNCKLEQELLD